MGVNNINSFMGCGFECTINSNRPELAIQLIESIPDINFKWINSTFKSYSEMINNSIKQSNSEYCIFLSDKARPDCSKNFFKIINLLRSGYGLVGLYGLGFFGLQKEVIRRIGFFDENFFGGGQEDLDFLFRLIEANIAYYYDLEIPYLMIGSTWQTSDAIKNNTEYLNRKWETSPDLSNWPFDKFYSNKRRIDETVPYKNEFGELLGTNFLNSTYTIHHK